MRFTGIPCMFLFGRFEADSRPARGARFLLSVPDAIQARLFDSTLTRRASARRGCRLHHLQPSRIGMAASPRTRPLPLRPAATSFPTKPRQRKIAPKPTCIAPAPIWRRATSTAPSPPAMPVRGPAGNSSLLLSVPASRPCGSRVRRSHRSRRWRRRSHTRHRRRRVRDRTQVGHRGRRVCGCAYVRYRRRGMRSRQIGLVVVAQSWRRHRALPA